MNSPILKAFVLCDRVSDKAGSGDQKDLHGAGLSRIECVGPFPAKVTFWAFVQLADQKGAAEVRFAILRADSGRRYFFRALTVQHKDEVQPTLFCVRFYDCVFPERGIYFLELWYDGAWLIDQRLEVI